MYKNEDDFIDRMGGSRKDLIESVLDSRGYENWIHRLPYVVDAEDPVVRAFWFNTVLGDH